jgi:hypothetical protein
MFIVFLSFYQIVFGKTAVTRPIMKEIAQPKPEFTLISKNATPPKCQHVLASDVPITNKINVSR